MSATPAAEPSAFERAMRDREAARYDDWYRRTKGVGFDRRERDIFRERATDARRALDLGSGTGRITDAVRAIPHVVAVDISLESLRQLAAKPLATATPVHADVTAIPVRSGSCDLVVSCQVLPLLRAPQMEAALREAARVLRPGGRLLASMYNRDYWRNRRAPEPIDAPDRLYMRRFSLEEFSDVASTIGFTRVRGDFYKALPDRGHVPERLSGWYALVDRAICQVVGRRAGCYLVYEGTRVG